MTAIDIEIAATRLPELLDRVEAGELIAITRSGASPVDLVPRSPRARRAAFYGAWKGRVDMSRFDEADEEIAREFGMLD
jgi:antitoxin (DNA-binding transcriptional repressor) of toxin-antitoxin stability system